MLRGDLESQMAACHAGGAGLIELATRYGVPEYEVLIDELLDYLKLWSELRSRTHQTASIGSKIRSTKMVSGRDRFPSKSRSRSPEPTFISTTPGRLPRSPQR